MSATDSQPLSQSVDEVQTSTVPVTQSSGPLCEDTVKQSSTSFCDDAVTQSSGPLCDVSDVVCDVADIDELSSHHETVQSRDTEAGTTSPSDPATVVTSRDTEAGTTSLSDRATAVTSHDTEAGTTVSVNSVPAATVTSHDTEAGTTSLSDPATAVTSRDTEAGTTSLSDPATAVMSRDTEAGTQSTSAGCQSPGHYVQKPVPLRCTPQSGRRPFPRTSPAYTVHNNSLDDAPNQVLPSSSATSTDTGLSSQDCNLSRDNDVNISTSRHVRHTSEPFSVTDAVSMDVKGRAELTSQLNSSLQISSASFKPVAESASLPSTPLNVISHTSLLA